MCRAAMTRNPKGDIMKKLSKFLLGVCFLCFGLVWAQNSAPPSPRQQSNTSTPSGSAGMIVNRTCPAGVRFGVVSVGNPTEEEFAQKCEFSKSKGLEKFDCKDFHGKVLATSGRPATKKDDGVGYREPILTYTASEEHSSPHTLKACQPVERDVNDFKKGQSLPKTKTNRSSFVCRNADGVSVSCRL